MAETFGEERLAVFAINDDRDIKKTQKIMAKIKTSLPILHDKGSKIFDTYRAHVIPTLYLIDQQGTIYESWTGTIENLELELTQNIEFVLKADNALTPARLQAVTK
ncbi:TlpA family protein disulfide reductase [Candidatus Poribacteria bacterium]|nr:TlpA family protein disulfide reductase [Candidatus Poribacteria bacterium]